jgi:signal transduction histidine kinase
MTPTGSSRSLGFRIFFGSGLWTVGLLGSGGIIAIIIGRHFPQILPVAHAVLLLAGALACMVAGFVQMRSGVSSFKRLRAQLSAVHEGRERRVDGSYPSEVQPLVNDLNALLDHREQVVRRAVAKAGDLAHGLKTPLAVIAREAERADAAGHHALAAAITQQVDRMRQQVDYHLAHARAAASGATVGARCSVETSAEGLARTLLRLHAERGISIHVNVPTALAVRVQREDLDEMLGNLLDNACKWAKSGISVESVGRDGSIVITVDDDGPGLEPSMLEAVLQRGVRADQAAPGSGFGLAIVRDLAELYGGSIALDRSPDGGVRACLRLPSC